ncbi:MAG: cytidylate kinase-like family protein [Spirochaetales bacterium]|nr:cytidylate kinase-like family protein [Spirochaetales bacterium]
MNVITISRYLNSGGITIGKRVAEELSYKFVTKETIEEIMSQYGMVNFDSVYESAPGFLDRLDHFQEDMVRFHRKVIQALAVHGRVVILGRGSFAVFPDYSDVLNVRLWAPLEVRVKRLMTKTNNTSWRQCMDDVTAHDRIRRAYVERWFHGHPDRANAFDLVINTAKVPSESAVSIIVDSAVKSGYLDLEKHKKLSELEVDTVLMETVNKILDS